MTSTVQTLRFYHGTSWENAQRIEREGFIPSADGCLGPGVYVARKEKAARFAEDLQRHGGQAGGLVEVMVTVKNAKFVRSNDSGWQAEGYDACRAEATSASTNMEWCIRDRGQLTVHRITKLSPAGVDVAEAEQHRASRSRKRGWADAVGGGRAPKRPPTAGDPKPDDDEAVLAERLAALDAEAALVAQERALVLSRQLAVERRKKEEREERARREAERARQEAERAEAERKRREEEAEAERRRQIARRRQRRGNMFQYLLYDRDFVSGLLDRADVSCIAMADQSTLCLYDSGSWGFSAGLPNGLHDTLNGRAQSHPAPIYCAMGSHGRYYIEFENGKSQWAGNDEVFNSAMYSRSTSVQRVAFGESEYDWCILWSNGSWESQGCPAGFTDEMHDKSHGGIFNIALGPGGEWFVAYEKGHWSYNGTTDQFCADAHKVQRGRQHLRDVCFGGGDTYIIRYGTYGGAYNQFSLCSGCAGDGGGQAEL